jgi:hypothetical protein
MMRETDRQEFIDAFFWKNGPCCAGCDWWHHLNSAVGECTRSAPLSAGDRVAMLGIHGTSLEIGAGHVMTPREHRCGEFRDTFDWSSLPIPYLKRVGAYLKPE